MSISRSDVEHVAKLARIHLSESEKEYYAEQLSAIFGYIDQLNEVDTTQVEGTVQVTGLSNIAREDTAVECSQDVVQDIQNQFPQKSCDLLQVKQILSDT